MLENSKVLDKLKECQQDQKILNESANDVIQIKTQWDIFNKQIRDDLFKCHASISSNDKLAQEHETAIKKNS